VPLEQPIDGVVISRNVDIGQTVAASFSTPTLFNIANDLSKMQIDANVAEADVGVVTIDQKVDFTVDAFPMQTFHGKVVQVRNAPITVQNVVTYNVVIDVDNPEQKLKPGMTANLTVTIDERNNVLKVANAALRFTPQDANNQRTGGGNGNSQGRRQQGANGAADGSGKSGNGGEVQFARPTDPVLAGQTRAIWVMGQDGKPQRRRVKIGLTDGASTEIVEGNLVEGEMVITGQTLSSSAAKSNSNQTAAPGFGGAPRTGGPAGGGRGR